MHKDLLQHLSHELWQTEVSASQHCRREAERLGDTPPARAMIATAEHADSVLKQLPELSLSRSMKRSSVGMALGKIFSEVRDTVADKLLTSERSYRGTILGLRHGVDLVQLMRATAEQGAEPELVTFFDQWLARRVPLVEQVVAQLQWFATRPDEAMKQARGLFAAKRTRQSQRV